MQPELGPLKSASGPEDNGDAIPCGHHRGTGSHVPAERAKYRTELRVRAVVYLYTVQHL